MATISERIAALEKTNVAYDLLLQTLREKDTETAHAVAGLSEVIQHPRTGLIVTLDRYQEAAKEDRRRVLAFFAGLVIVVNVIVPFVPALLRLIWP